MKLVYNSYSSFKGSKYKMDAKFGQKIGTKYACLVIVVLPSIIEALYVNELWGGAFNRHAYF